MFPGPFPLYPTMTMAFFNRRWLFLLLLWGFFIEPASHRTVESREIHPFSQVTGTFYVSKQRISARLTIFVEDLYLFHEMEPDNEDRLYKAELEPARLDHQKFLLDRVQILDADGKPLPSRIVDVSALNITENGWSVDELMDHSIDYDLEFELDSEPEFLTIVQDIVDANFVFRSELRLVVRQEGRAELTTSILRPGDPFTVRLDWSGDQPDLEASEEEIEEWLNRGREATLGITSYDSVYSFLYITRREVRHEILIPLGTLARIFEIPRADPDFLTVAEQQTARILIEQYYAEGNPIKIDGIEVAPIADRVDFYGLSLKDFAQRAEPRDVSMASGRVGIILVYPCKGEPANVELTWTKFTSDIRKVETVVFTSGESGKFEFSRFKEENTYRWENPNRQDAQDFGPVPADLPPQKVYPWISALLILGWAGLISIFSSLRSQKLIAIGSGTLSLILSAALFFTPQLWLPLPWEKPPSISSAQQSNVFKALLSNVYRAFDYRDSEEVYDSLAESVAGDLLSDVYLEIRRGLEVQEQGGAVALVDDVEFLEVLPKQNFRNEQIDSPGYVIQCRWNVSGTVEHWGHIHRRKNQYVGNFEVRPFEGDWRLVGLDLTHEERLENKRELRKF